MTGFRHAAALADGLDAPRWTQLCLNQSLWLLCQESVYSAVACDSLEAEVLPAQPSGSPGRPWLNALMPLHLISPSRNAKRPNFSGTVSREASVVRNLGVPNILQVPGAWLWGMVTKLDLLQCFLAQGKEEKGTTHFFSRTLSNFSEAEKNLEFRAAALSGKKDGKFDCVYTTIRWPDDFKQRGKCPVILHEYMFVGTKYKLVV